MSTIKSLQSRREFLKSLAVAGAGTALVGSHAATGAASTIPAGISMPMRPFGQTGVDVSSLSLGGIIDFRSNQLLLEQAYKLGITYWDTADSYSGGKSEEGIGRFLTRRPETRGNIFLVTKTEARSIMMRDIALEASLKNLKTDYIDLYLMHMVRYTREWDLPEVQRWAKTAKAAGKIRFFGFSAHTNMVDQLHHAATLNWVDGVMFTYNYRIMQMPEMVAAVEACHRAGIGLTAMKTMGGGPGESIPEADDRLGRYFLDKGFSEHQAKLKSVWEDSRIASICSHMPNTTIMLANAAAAMNKSALSNRDRIELERHADATRSVYCAGCSEICEQTMAEWVPIGDVMRSLMYLESHGEPERARETLARVLPAEPGRLLSQDFSAAQRVCPQGLDIAALMQRAIDRLT